MVAVERVGRYVEQIDAMRNKRQDDLDRAAVERHLKSKVVSKIVLWTLHNRRRFRETVMCAEPPAPFDEYYDSHQTHAGGPRDYYESWSKPQEYVREYVVMDDPVRIDEFDGGDTDTENDECRDDAEAYPLQKDVRHDDLTTHLGIFDHVWRTPPVVTNSETVALHDGEQIREGSVGTKRFSVECVGRDDSTIKSTIADQVVRAVEELQRNFDPLNYTVSSARPVETVEVEIKVHRQLNNAQSSSMQAYRTKNLVVATDQLDVAEPPSMDSWCMWWSTRGWWSCGE